MTTAPSTARTRAQRQALVLRLVTEEEIGSQEELQKALRGEGVRATQATLSRDIRDLGLVKLGGVYRPAPELPPSTEEALASAVRRFLTGVDVSGNMIVMHTGPGSASAADVEIDRARLPGLLGTIAGDDTILAVARSPRAARDLVRRFREMLR